ncbi:MAG: hypothetical protein MI865_05315 [Proteobacteria bacterium]|nr:hypothetical protein [Pseudomonadota bacterium]
MGRAMNQFTVAKFLKTSEIYLRLTEKKRVDMEDSEYQFYLSIPNTQKVVSSDISYPNH